MRTGSAGKQPGWRRATRNDATRIAALLSYLRELQRKFQRPSSWSITPAKTPTPAFREKPCAVRANFKVGAAPISTCAARPRNRPCPPNIAPILARSTCRFNSLTPLSELGPLAQPDFPWRSNRSFREAHRAQILPGCETLWLAITNAAVTPAEPAPASFLMVYATAPPCHQCLPVDNGVSPGWKGIYNGFGGGEYARVVRARGGIGRREGLRILWRNPCRFDPCRAHALIFQVSVGRGDRAFNPPRRSGQLGCLRGIGEVAHKGPRLVEEFKEQSL